MTPLHLSSKRFKTKSEAVENAIDRAIVMVSEQSHRRSKVGDQTSRSQVTIQPDLQRIVLTCHGSTCEVVSAGAVECWLDRSWRRRVGDEAKAKSCNLRPTLLSAANALKSDSKPSTASTQK